MGKAYSSSIYGGSVLTPVGSINGRRTKNNPLHEEISKMEVQSIKAGNYYVLKHVRKSSAHNIYLDIYLLTGSIQDQKLMQKIKAIHDSSKGVYTDPKLAKQFKNGKSSPYFFDDIKEAITGFARIIEYANHSVPEYIDANDPYSGHGVISFDP